MSPILDSIGSVKSYGWGAVSAAVLSYESIASINPISGTFTTSITFNSIPSTYSSLQIRYIIQPNASDSLALRFNGNSSTVYDFHALNGDGASVVASNLGTGQTYIQAFGYYPMNASYMNAGIIDIHDYASTTKNKVIRSFSGVDNNSTGGSVQLRSGNWRNTDAVTSITLYTVSSNHMLTGTSFALYGIKGA